MRKILRASFPPTLFLLVNILLGINIVAVVSSLNPPTGHDILGSLHPNFPVKELSKALDKGTPLGFLDFTFNESLKHAKRTIRIIEPSVVRVHIFNGSGVHLRNSGKYDPLYGLTNDTFDYLSKTGDKGLRRHFTKRLLLWKRLAEKYPGTTFYVSPVLEHRLTRKAYRKWADTAIIIWPEVRLVNNPASCKGQRYKGALLECHTSARKADIYSTDGVDALEMDYDAWLKRTKNAAFRFVWTPGYNLRVKDEPQFVDPRERTNTLSVYDIVGMANMTNKEVLK